MTTVITGTGDSLADESAPKIAPFIGAKVLVRVEDRTKNPRYSSTAGDVIGVVGVLQSLTVTSKGDGDARFEGGAIAEWHQEDKLFIANLDQ